MTRLWAGLIAGALFAGVPLRSGRQRLRWPDGHLALKLASSVHGPFEGTGVDPGESAEAVAVAIQEAVRAWSEALPARVRIETELVSDTRLAGGSGNLVTFTDPEPFDSGVCDKRTAAACTVLTYSLADGTIERAGIAFNPYLKHSSIGLAGSHDIGKLMLHELGHALGLDHSALFDAVMNPFVETKSGPAGGSFDLRELSADDRLTLAETYAAEETAAGLAWLDGTAQDGGAPVEGAHVMALDKDGRALRDTLTDSEGGYSLLVEPGGYRVALEPLDGPVFPAQLTQGSGGPAKIFPTLFWSPGGGELWEGATVSAQPGSRVSLDGFRLRAGASADLAWVAWVDQAGNYFPAYQVALAREATHRVLLSPGAEAGTPRLRLAAPGLLPQGEPVTIPGPPALVLLRLGVATKAAVGAYSLEYSSGVAGALLPNVLRVTTNPRILALRDSASGARLERCSPGQWILVEGTDLAAREERREGPRQRWPTQLGGVAVRFGRQFAELARVSPGELVVRIPLDAAAGEHQLAVVPSPVLESPSLKLLVDPGPLAPGP